MPDQPLREEINTTALIQPDGSVNRSEFQKCMETIGQRCKDALDALAKVCETAGSQKEQAIMQVTFAVGLEIGALLRDIPNFQKAFQNYGRDPEFARRVNVLSLYVEQLDRAIDMMAIPGDDQAVADGASSSSK